MNIPGRHEIDVDDVEFRRHGGEPLLARLYVPRGAGPFPLVVELHGGAWCRGNRLDDESMNRALAERGIVVAAVDFRQPPQAGYPASLADINHALRWLKANAARWRARPCSVGVMGVSSGAHQAMLAAMRPHDARYAALPLAEHEDTDATVAFAVLCWPVIDPIGRYRYAHALRASVEPYPEAIDRVIPDHDRYWPDEAAMAEGSPLQALERGEAVHTPPVLYLQGDADRMHPREQLDRFVAAYRRAGGELTLKIYAGEDTGFVTRRPDAPATADALRAIAAFVHEKFKP